MSTKYKEMRMKIGDKVSITNDDMKRLYGIKDADVFEVGDVIGQFVMLKGTSWWLDEDHLKHVDDNEEFNLEDVVGSEIAMAVDEDMAFTAYDITKKIRSENPNEKVYHSQVKDIVHMAMSEYDNYDKTLIDVGVSGSLQPWLYYPKGYDPNSYDVNGGVQILKLNVEDDVISPPDPKDNWDNEGGLCNGNPASVNADFTFKTDPSFGKKINLGDGSPTKSSEGLFVKLIKKLAGKV